MIPPNVFYQLLIDHGFHDFVGVPDSLLKHFNACLLDHGHEWIAPNEGSALAMAAGLYLGSQRIPVVYLQNSGFGNLVNPLNSLMDKQVYGLPALILMGWRGEPLQPDEPQHRAQGSTQEAQLKALGHPYAIMGKDERVLKQQLLEATSWMQAHGSPYFFLIQAQSFEPYTSTRKNIVRNYPKREAYLEALMPLLSEDFLVVSTTGKTSREWFELREKNKHAHSKDFLSVGSMGHASQIALGLAIKQPSKKVLCIDGDGALIMHMGSLATIGQLAPKNLIHVVINNGAHESVGGQPTAGFDVDIPKIAEACGYAYVSSVEDLESFNSEFLKVLNREGPMLLELKSSVGSRADLGRPSVSPQDNKKELMNYLHASGSAVTHPPQIDRSDSEQNRPTLEGSDSEQNPSTTNG